MFLHSIKNKEARSALKASMESDKRFPYLQWSTYSFHYGKTTTDATALFLSYLGWVARDVQGHFHTLMSIEDKNGSVHLHCVIASDIKLKWRDLHRRWYKNQGFSEHKIYNPKKGGIIYLAQPRHKVIVLDDPITCGFPTRCKGRRRGCVMKTSKKRTGTEG